MELVSSWEKLLYIFWCNLAGQLVRKVNDEPNGISGDACQEDLGTVGVGGQIVGEQSLEIRTAGRQYQPVTRERLSVYFENDITQLTGMTELTESGPSLRAELLKRS